MLKHVYLIFVATFVFGLVTGALIFMSSHMDKSTESDTSGDVSKGYTISVYEYGVCNQAGCPLFHIAQDGAYTYIAPDGSRYEGTLPFATRRDIGNALTALNFDALQDSRFVGTCPASQGGNAYRYDVIFSAQEYHLDSCTQTLGGGAPFDTLNRLFVQFAEQHGQ